MVALVLISFSCDKKAIESTETNQSLNYNSNNIEKLKLYNEFAILLSKAVIDNSDLRLFIKDVALRKVNNDNDVFYHFVKNEIVKGKQSFKETLKKYETYTNQLEIIENKIPLLTIFVPTIEQSNFSPETWNVETEIPLVATNFMKHDKTIPIYENGEELLTMSTNEVPGFPVLVVKSNERIRLNEKIKLRNMAPLSQASFDFISPAFDGTRKMLLRNSTQTREGIKIDSSIVRAYNTFGINNTKWQRDYVYYNLTNEKLSGPLNLNMVESIVSLKISRAALSKISDQTGDPYLTTNPNKEIDVPKGISGENIHSLIQKNAWTDGQFEFRFDVLINNSRGVGTATQIYLPIAPVDLFHIPYNYTLRTIRGKTQAIVVYRLGEKTTRSTRASSTPTFGKEVIINLPIINWDIQSNASLWKISLFETDTQETYTEKETVTNEFATNFGFNLEILEKLGLNFGGSSKEVRTSEISITRTVGDDDLGSVFIDFGHPIITGYGVRGGIELKEYSNQYFSIKVIPTKSYNTN